MAHTCISLIDNIIIISHIIARIHITFFFIYSFIMKQKLVEVKLWIGYTLRIYTYIRKIGLLKML